MSNMLKRIKKALTAVLVFSILISSAAGCSGGNGAAGSQKEPGAGITAQTAEPVEQAAEPTAQDAAFPDGTYEPTLVEVEGGTGKVKITCPEVVLAGGKAEALLEFSSPHYEWVKAEGVQYDPENAGEDRKNSVFRVPVTLDEKMKISALTTAMSEPHEIEYTLLISLTQHREASEEEGTSEEDVPEEEEALFGTESSSLSGTEVTGTPKAGDAATAEPPELPGLTMVSKMEKSYAEAFDIYYYEREGAGTETEDTGRDRYSLITTYGGGQYLLLPESSAAQSEDMSWLGDLPASVTVLQAPLDNIYVAASASMALFEAAKALDKVKLTGTKAEDWYIDAPKKALENGSMVYAGRYSAPDYELLTTSGCDLAVESLMILHAPEVKEKLEELGIPVLIDTSSTERHPLGRTEWVRLYGVLTGQEAEADAFFEAQAAQFAEAETYTDTGLTVAFFSVSSNGNVVVRAADDYISRMIVLAGGRYAFDELLSGSGYSSSVRLSMEEFYNTAKDADFLIYNATIERPVRGVSELCGQFPLLADFKAVDSGNVWQVRRSLYQSPDIAAQMITDMHKMLTGQNTDEMTFLEHLQ